MFVNRISRFFLSTLTLAEAVKLLFLLRQPDSRAYFPETELSSQNGISILDVTRTCDNVSAGVRFQLCRWVSRRRTRFRMFNAATEPFRRYGSEFTAAVPDNHIYLQFHTWTERLR